MPDPPVPLDDKADGSLDALAQQDERGVTAGIELLPSIRVGEALTRLEKGDVRYRFVLGLSDLG